MTMLFALLKPCQCVRMSEALVAGNLVMGVIRDGGESSPIIGFIAPGKGSGVDPIVYCPWCGNAAFEVLSKESDEKEPMIQHD